MNEFEAKLFERLLDENKELKTDLENCRSSQRNSWTLQSENTKLKERVTRIEAVLTPKQREKVDA